MKIVIIGGSGLIGSKLAARLGKGGHQVVAASPSTGVNALTGEGLSNALAGADVLVDVANSPSFADDAVMSFFQTSTKNLLAAAKTAGVKHYVALSVVGADRNPESGYLRAKVAQEEALRQGGVPFTIVRATQFFEFIGRVADASTQGTTVRLSSALMQPIAADDVVAALADFVVAAPLGGMREIAGPEAIGIDDLARKLFAAKHDPRNVVTDTSVRYFGGPVDDTSLTPGKDPRLGPTRFAAWLEQSA